MSSRPAATATWPTASAKTSLSTTPADEDCHYVTDDLKDIAQAVHRALGIGRTLLFVFLVLAVIMVIVGLVNRV